MIKIYDDAIYFFNLIITIIIFIGDPTCFAWRNGGSGNVINNLKGIGANPIPICIVGNDLVGEQIIAVCNFPTKNIAGVVSEVLILGAIEKDGKVVLLNPSQKVENGLEVY